jgi:hypothetical protein
LEGCLVEAAEAEAGERRSEGLVAQHGAPREAGHLGEGIS